MWNSRSNLHYLIKIYGDPEAFRQRPLRVCCQHFTLVRATVGYALLSGRSFAFLVSGSERPKAADHP
jgi:hypothetical protein